jgi:hypothetical protein
VLIGFSLLLEKQLIPIHKKMKIKLNLILLSLLLGIDCFAQDTLKTESKIEKVVVFLKGAQINRKSQLRAAQGHEPNKFH